MKDFLEDRAFDDELRAALDAAVRGSVGLETGPQCPDFFRFLDADIDGWSPSEEEHVASCRSCQRRLAMLQRSSSSSHQPVRSPAKRSPTRGSPARRRVAAMAAGLVLALAALAWLVVAIANARTEREHRAEVQAELLRQRAELEHQRFLIGELSIQQEALHDDLRTLIRTVERQLSDDEEQLREREARFEDPKP